VGCCCADGPRVGYFAEYWYTTYKCKASVGLSYPGDSLTQMQGFFKNMVSETSPYSGSKGKFRSIGTWGLPDDDGSPMAELWWSSMKAFLAADENVGQEALSLPAVADTVRAATLAGSPLHDTVQPLVRHLEHNDVCLPMLP
jgi:hypothetical protein